MNIRSKMIGVFLNVNKVMKGFLVFFFLLRSAGGFEGII